MITIVTWIWKGDREYTATHVSYVGDMLHRYMLSPYRFVAIVDDTSGEFGPYVDVMEMPPKAHELASIKTPETRMTATINFPSSYPRLWMFSEEAKMLGERVVLTDVDIVVAGDWAPLVSGEADFVGWKPGQLWGNTEHRVAGGMWLLRTGSHTEVYDDFIRDPEAAKLEARRAGFRGSDQAWISYKLAHKVPVWPEGSGIYSVRDFTRLDRGAVVPTIPDDARVVHFNGIKKPWDKASWAQHPWIAQHWVGNPPWHGVAP